MSYCRKEGKDTIIFVTKEDHVQPSSIALEEEDEMEGAILPNGEINWECPCLGGMASGPCGFEFRESFSCFHKSTEESKGSECFEEFSNWRQCMMDNVSYYGPVMKDEEEDEKADAELESRAEEGSRQLATLNTDNNNGTETKDNTVASSSSDSSEQIS